MTEEIKIYYPETIDEEPLPDGVAWDSIINRPRTLTDLDPEAKAVLDSVEADFLSLGDLAYLDSITTTEITDSAITTPKIAAGAIVASKISVGSLSAISADMGTITAGTVTGALLRTSASGARVEIQGSTDRIRIYDSSDIERMRLDEDELRFYDGAGNLTGILGALYSNILAITIPAGELGFVVYYDDVTDPKFAVGLTGSVFYDDADFQNNDIVGVGNIEAFDDTADIGTSAVPFDRFYIQDIYLTPQASNPTVDGQVRYYQNGGTHELRVQLNGVDFSFDLSAV